MFDTSSKGIVSLLGGGESQTVEFKARFPSSHVIASAIAAFANTDGGIILIGVSDTGEVLGLSEFRVDNAVARLKKIAASLLPSPIQIGSAEIESKRVVYAIVQKVVAPHAPIMTSRGEIYERQSHMIVLRSTGSAGPPRDANRDAPAKPKLSAFVAMSFHEEEEPALVDYFHAMDRALKQLDIPVQLRRVDLVEGDYEISQKIMDEIDDADIVIADFTLNSPSVYFEVGYARAKERRIIQTARKGTALEFDIRNWRTLFYRNATELEEKLVPELKSACAALQSIS